LSNCITFIFDTAGRALNRALGHLDIFGLPIDLWVVVVESIVPQYHTLLVQVSDCKLSALRVVVIAEDNVSNFDYHAYLICHTIDIIDWDQIGEGAYGDII
jgi:hypothetical protein